MTISQRIQDLCTAPISNCVSYAIRHDPSAAVSDVYDKLYPQSRSPSLITAIKSTKDGRRKSTDSMTNISLAQAEKCGRWNDFGGAGKPSELFLQIYHDALQPLDTDVRASVVSPNLMGSSGVCPLTITSIIPDIMRHYANCIIRAKHEIFIATNYWAASAASSIIVSALRALSDKVVKEGRDKVVVKILYDRGSPKQVLDHHIYVDEKTYSSKEVDLPTKESVPGLELEVVNYHVPSVGTFHAKWAVIDRRIALLNSNNIQDVPNFEMMTHWEGPIVNSFYDMALISWHKGMHPVFPCLLDLPDQVRGPYKFAKNTDVTSTSDTDEVTTGVNNIHIQENTKGNGFPKQYPDHPFSSSQMNEKTNASPSPPTSPSRIGVNQPSKDLHTAPKIQNLLNAEHQDNVAAAHKEAEKTEKDGAGIDTHLGDGDIVIGDDFEHEARRVKSQLKTLDDVTRHLNTTIQPHTKGTAPLDTDLTFFSPYRLMPEHEPFPIALVNRIPYGPPGHQSVHTPQNAAWLAGLKYAKKFVFIQTPDLNSVPLMDEIVNAVKRGVEVTLWLCLGYNDSGEMLPMQGGTNEAVTCKLYNQLETREKEFLKVCWYTAKDQIKPIHAKDKKRTCHIKLMTIDNHVGIQGSGNQDTQSWYHSQEANVLIDSELVVKQWMSAIFHNQNTDEYGHVDPTDGIWKDPHTRETLVNTTGGKEGKFDWMKGIAGAVARVQGKGGF